MEPNKYDFTNVAVKCDTWEQMGKLAAMARECGAVSFLFSDDYFPDCNFFVVYNEPQLDNQLLVYTNIMTVPENYTIIPYDQFISNPVKQ